MAKKLNVFMACTEGAARLFDFGRTISQVKRDSKTSTLEKSLITVNKANEEVQRNMALAIPILLKKAAGNGIKFSSEGKSGYGSVLVKAKDRVHNKVRYYKVSKKCDAKVDSTYDKIESKFKKTRLKGISGYGKKEIGKRR